MASVLVVYATKYGSTKEVAEAVAETLRDKGLSVDVRAAGDVTGGLDSYSAVVVGGALYAQELVDVRGQLDKALSRFEWLTPVAVSAFGGAFFPERLRFPDNNPAMKSMPAADARDWDAIGAWSETLPTAFRLGLPEPGADPPAGTRSA